MTYSSTETGATRRAEQGQDTRWQRRKEARPAEIIEAALQLFVEHGYAATRLEDIANAAGISKGSLYRYFENKESLFKEMVKQVVIPEIERAESTALAHQGQASVLIEQMVNNWWCLVGESHISGIPKLIISEAANFPELAAFYVEAVIQRVRKLVAGMIQRGIDNGEFRADLSPDIAARILISPLVFASIWKRSLATYDEPYDVHNYLALQTEVFLRGIKRDAE